MRKMRRSFSGNRTTAAFFLGLAVGGAGLACHGCGAACSTSNDDNPPTRYVGGTATGDLYESSPLTSGWLPFPGGKQYQLDHHLGFTPAVVAVDIAFDANGTSPAHCAGNSCLTPCRDDEMVWIQNDTCADFWVRVVALGRSSEHRGTACTDGAVVASGDAGPSANDGGIGPESAGEEPLPGTDGSPDALENAAFDAAIVDAGDATAD